MIDLHIQRFSSTGDERHAVSAMKHCVDNKLYSIGVIVGKYLCKLLFWNLDIVYLTSKCAIGKNNYSLAYNLLSRILTFKGLPDNTIDQIIDETRQCVSHIENRYIYYNPNIVKRITTRKNKPIPLVTLTITSCKRFDLFKQTVNSFLNCCTDLHLIDRWICVDDNSSDEDREQMKEMYPFFEFIFKPVEQKGHPQSMNIIKKMLNTPYYFHMEDDWKFFVRRDYISDCMDVLQSAPTIGQCLINRNYAETGLDNIKGGFRKNTYQGTRYFLHEFCNTEETKQKFNEKYGNVPNCSYWCHFSFRPSLVRTVILHKIGDFNEKISHFEMDYAYRYFANGYVSAFLEGTYSLHIGRLTSERNDKNKPNAYELNGEAQLSGKENQIQQNQKENVIEPTGKNQIQKKAVEPIAKPIVSNKPPEKKKIQLKVMVVNLDRRPDRWEKFQKNDIGIKYQRYPAVDGSKLLPTEQLQRIFDGNDYNMRSGMVGCAMSHIKLCIDLINSEDDMFIIMEDDVEVVPDFTKKFVHVLRQLDDDWDIVYLGHHLFPHYRKPEFYDKDKMPIVEKWSRTKSLTYSMGGTGGYVISQKGAYRLLDFINKTGMTNGIDTVQQKAADEMQIYYCNPHLIYSECWTGSNSPDTDIQFCYDSLTIPIEERIQNELTFYKQDGIQTVHDMEEMRKLVTSDTLTDVLIYIGNPIDVVSLKNECVHPRYTINDKALIVVPKPTQRHLDNRYFERLNKNGVYDVTDALKLTT